MDFLGVGPLEILFIVLIALIVLGPKDMVKTGRTLGRWLNRLVHSPAWKAVRETSSALRKLPTQLMREANLEDELNGIQKDLKTPQLDFSAWTQSQPSILPPNSLSPKENQPGSTAAESQPEEAQTHDDPSQPDGGGTETA